MAHSLTAWIATLIAESAHGLGAGLLLVAVAPAQAGWTQLGPGPTARRNLALAWDTNRSRLVLFGGEASGGYLGGTQEWNGNGWSWATPSVFFPSARTNMAMAYDSLRSRAVLFGGYDGTSFLADTWEWDGAAWSRRTPAVSPPGRAGHALVYDAARGSVVLFGGQTSTAFVTADTWEWDGTNWTQRTPATSPTASTRAAMAYDGTRQRVVMVGGGILGNETWEYDGNDWTRRTPATNPPAQLGPAMAHDPMRGRTVLFVSGQTWEWDGTDWRQVLTAAFPPALAGHGMAYDTQRRHVVLFGGTTSIIPFAASAELWEFDGLDWNRLSSGASSPPPRSRYAMAYDARLDQVVVFGGRTGNGNTSFGDTWELRGSEWRQRSPQFSPAPRESAPLVHDSAHGRCVLFGGINSNFQYLTDTWLYDGTTWLPTNQNGPPPRFDHVMACDSFRGFVVLFGGSQGTGGQLRDTWEWDGTRWWQRTPALSPPAFGAMAMAYDSLRGVTVLHGVVSGNPEETWEWNGTNWALRARGTPSAVPVAMAYDSIRHRVVLLATQSLLSLRAYEWDGVAWTNASSPGLTLRVRFAMAYDVARHRVALFGGEDSTGGAQHDDTWAYHTPSPTITTYGTGCPGTTGSPRFSSSGLPWLDTWVLMRVSGARPLSSALFLHGYSDQTWAGIPLPFRLTPLGAPLCVLLNSIDSAFGIQTDASGSGQLYLGIPNSGDLTGLLFYDQFAVYDPGANALGFSFTQGTVARIGGL